MVLNVRRTAWLDTVLVVVEDAVELVTVVVEVDVTVLGDAVTVLVSVEVEVSTVPGSEVVTVLTDGGPVMVEVEVDVVVEVDEDFATYPAAAPTTSPPTTPAPTFKNVLLDSSLPVFVPSAMTYVLGNVRI